MQKSKHLTKPKLIEDKNQRNVTFCKRRRGLLKKIIELSLLCGQDIYLVMFDKEKQKLLQYSSSEDFDSKVVHHLTSPDTRQQFTYESYLNSHYDKFLKGKEKSEADSTPEGTSKDAADPNSNDSHNL